MKVALITKFRFFCLFVFLFFGESNLAQEKSDFKVVLLSMNDSLPIVNAHLVIKNGENETIYVSNQDGVFNIKEDLLGENLHIEFSALGYEKLVKENLTKKIYYAKDSVEELSEVNIISKKDQPKLNLKPSLISRLNKSKRHFAWQDKSAVYIPYNSKYGNVSIKRLKYKVTNYEGVKGIEYLPFIANIYAVDKKTNLPGKPLIENIITKKDFGEKWAVVDVTEYNIIIPKEGVFVIYEILEHDYYETNMIQSKIGVISAVPALEVYQFDKNYVSKSYDFFYTPQKLTNRYLAYGKTEATGWAMVNWHYIIEIEQ